MLSLACCYISSAIAAGGPSLSWTESGIRQGAPAVVPRSSHGLLGRRALKQAHEVVNHIDHIMPTSEWDGLEEWIDGSGDVIDDLMELASQSGVPGGYGPSPPASGGYHGIYGYSMNGGKRPALESTMQIQTMHNPHACACHSTFPQASCKFRLYVRVSRLHVLMLQAMEEIPS